MSATFANAMLGKAEKVMPDPGTGKAISVKDYVTIVPIITTTAAPSATTVTVNATNSDLTSSFAGMDRAVAGSVVLTGNGGTGATGSGAGGKGGGGGEYVAWTTHSFSAASILSPVPSVTIAAGDAAFTTFVFGGNTYKAGNGATGGAGSGAGGTGGSAESTVAATTDNDGGAGGAGQAGAAGAGGGGGEGAGAAAAGNAGSAGAAGVGGAGGTGTAGADGGAGGDTGLTGNIGTAPGGGGGGGSDGFAGDSGGAGRAVITFTTAAETNTLPDPTISGAWLQLHAKTLSGNRVIYADTAFDSTGNDTICLDTEDDVVILKSVPASTTTGYRWQLVANKGAVLWAA